MLATSISPDMPSNSSRFTDEFYKRFQLRPKTVKLDESIEKTYMFPTFYGDVTQAVGVFLCSYDRASELMPHPGLKPVSMGKGRSLAIFSCYEYKEVHQIEPYNEIAMTIPVMANPALNVPVIPMLLGSRLNKFGYYVFSMPVTSRENCIRGNTIWGLPKVTREIRFETDPNIHTCRAMEENGEPYFELKIPKKGKKIRMDDAGYLYSKLNGAMLKSKTCFTGEYAVNKNMSRLFSKESSDEPVLWLGNTPSGDWIRCLDLDCHPFQTMYAEHVQSCFDLPDQSQMEFIKKNLK